MSSNRSRLLPRSHHPRDAVQAPGAKVVLRQEIGLFSRGARGSGQEQVQGREYSGQ
ncbi:hypothetical protein [Leptolyngbya sp. FACHB-261]|uniref:hypothetical protein n=1 Tax=Leptolyngbya sp. FACHB-261 TaxID=2692806 RepID=UPI001689331A|nr:hypothetical protein [Leptolyngbya sp. FACHB-261]MBD2100945.1 hypothetical protein [Leptolyngbya sp. FACHB-261]